MLLRPIVGERVVDRADVFPDEHVALFPRRGMDVLRLQLMAEEVLQHLVAFLLRELVDAYRITGIRIEHHVAAERMAQEHRMRYRRLRATLRLGERRPLAAIRSAATRSEE